MSETIAPKKRSRRLWRVLGKVLLVLVALVLIEEGLFTLLANRQARLLEQELDGWRATGFLKTLEELEQPLPPESQNAAPLYLKAANRTQYSLADDDAARDVQVALLEGRSAPEAVAKLRKVIAAQAWRFELLERASRLPVCVFELDREPRDGYFQGARKLARWLWASQVLNAYDGKSQDAAQDFILGFSLIRGLLETPGNLGVYSASACYELVMGGLGRALDKAPVSPDRYLALADAAKTVNPGSDFWRLMVYGEAALDQWGLQLARGELPASAAFTYFTFEDLFQDKDHMSIWRVPGGVKAWALNHCAFVRWKIAKDARAYTQLSGRMLIQAREDIPIWERLSEAEVISEKAAGRYWLTPGFGPSGQNRISLYGSLVRRTAVFQARLACSEVALSAGAVATSDWLPKSIADVERKLGRKLPLDPFTSKPLNWKLEGGKLTVSSVGESGKPYPPSFSLRIR